MALFPSGNRGLRDARSLSHLFLINPEDVAPDAFDGVHNEARYTSLHMRSSIFLCGGVLDTVTDGAHYAPMNNRPIAQLIIDLRAALGNINQEQLAARIGVSQPTVSRWEKGIANPDHQSMVAMARLDPRNDYEMWFGPKQSEAEHHVPDRAQKSLPETTAGAVRFLRETDPRAWPKDLKILGFVRAGAVGYFPDNGETLDMTHRPPSLNGVRNAYAVIVNDESMLPAYKPGWVIWVHPWRRPDPGDDVIIQTPDGQAFIKQLVRRAGNQIICKQWNPEKELRFDQEKVTIHLVVGTGRDP